VSLADKVKKQTKLTTETNLVDLSKMALPPCHMFCQFYVNLEPTPTLSCVLYQRSADMGLGVPFNIASYSLLILMICHVTGYQPGEFVHVLGDAHVYRNHVEALRVQLEREPKPFPQMKIHRLPGSTGRLNVAGEQVTFEVPSPTKTINQMMSELETFELSDFELVGYEPHASVKMDMAV